MTVKLAELLEHLDAEDFAARLKNTLQQLPAGSLPLHLATSQGGMVDDSDISVTVLSHRIEQDFVSARIGVFFTETVGGCNCHDDPLAVNGYCRLSVQIDRSSAATRFRLLADPD